MPSGIALPCPQTLSALAISHTLLHTSPRSACRRVAAARPQPFHTAPHSACRCTTAPPCWCSSHRTCATTRTARGTSRVPRVSSYRRRLPRSSALSGEAGTKHSQVRGHAPCRAFHPTYPVQIVTSSAPCGPTQQVSYSLCGSHLVAYIFMWADITTRCSALHQASSSPPTPPCSALLQASPPSPPRPTCPRSRRGQRRLLSPRPQPCWAAA